MKQFSVKNKYLTVEYGDDNFLFSYKNNNRKFFSFFNNEQIDVDNYMFIFDFDKLDDTYNGEIRIYFICG